MLVTAMVKFTLYTPDPVNFQRGDPDGAPIPSPNTIVPVSSPPQIRFCSNSHPAEAFPYISIPKQPVDTSAMIVITSKLEKMRRFRGVKCLRNIHTTGRAAMIPATGSAAAGWKNYPPRGYRERPGT